MDDMVSRKAVIDAVHTATYGFICGAEDGDEMTEADKLVLSINKAVCTAIKALPSVQSEEVARDIATIIENEKDMRVILKNAQQMWIPVTEKLPEDLEAVNITWVNHEPEPYYHDIKDKNFVATGIHYRDKWYWYSTTCADFLGEYGSNEVEEVDDAVEIIAWMPLPEPYKGEQE